MGFFKSLFGLYTPEEVGQIGEEKIANKLDWLDLFGYRGKILQNVYVPKGNGETTEIDIVYITAKGLFVIESKNYAGYIFGDEDSQQWTVTLYAGEDWLGRSKVDKYKFYNPIKQNLTHARFLEKYLNRIVPMLSVIVFSDRAEIKKMSIHSPDVVVCTKANLSRVIKDTWRGNPDVLSDEDIKSIYDCLPPLTNVDFATKQFHIESINNRINSMICPRCGGQLVLRTVKRGPNEGNQFYGCSNYPRCTFTRPF